MALVEALAEALGEADGSTEGEALAEEVVVGVPVEAEAAGVVAVGALPVGGALVGQPARRTTRASAARMGKGYAADPAPSNAAGGALAEHPDEGAAPLVVEAVAELEASVGGGVDTHAVLAGEGVAGGPGADTGTTHRRGQRPISSPAISFVVASKPDRSRTTRTRSQYSA